MLCVSKEAFYKELETYKQNQKRNSSQTTLFIEDKFYDSAKEFVKSQAENALTESNTVNHNTTKLTKLQATTLKRKKWSYHQRKILLHFTLGILLSRETMVAPCLVKSVWLRAASGMAQQTYPGVTVLATSEANEIGRLV